ncbi:MAG: hypothetical protein ABIH01_05065 [Candidatus Omnitrophota bacterium]
MKKIYLPYMCDHARLFAATLRRYGKDAEVLPESNDETLNFGRWACSGKECMPCLVTLGDIICKVKEPSFNRENTQFFFPTASGPCKYGQYVNLHKLLLEKLGYGKIEFLSPTSKDGYGELGSIFMQRRLWQAIVATDIILKLLYQIRPYEINKGDADKAYAKALSLLEQAMEKGGIPDAMRRIKDLFAAVRIDVSIKRPRIGIVGEVFIRLNRFSNQNIARFVEELGGEAQVSPLSEWIFWTVHTHLERCIKERTYTKFLKALLRDIVQRVEEERLYGYFKGLLRDMHEPAMQTVMKYASPYANFSFGGEAILTIGKAIDYVKKGACGILNLMPFTCMPSTVVAGLAKRIRADYGWVPWLDIAYDAQEEVNIRTRLEAFMYQANKFQERALIKEGV